MSFSIRLRTLAALALAPALVLASSCHLKEQKAEQRRTTGGGAPAPTPQTVESGGVIDGNGGEFISTEHNPWFVGKAAVPYCIEAGEGVSIAPAEAAKQIASVFGVWKELLTTLRFEGIYVSSDEFGKEPPKYDLALDFTEVTCAAKPPLTFKLGVSDESVTTALHYTAAKMVGFALRTAYDESSGMGRGFIWLAPDRGASAYSGPKSTADFWSQPDLFQSVIAHEIGHVLGFQHVKKTIMDARLPARIVEQGPSLAWKGDEFRADFRWTAGFCGVLAMSDPVVLKEIFQLDSAAGVSVCLKWREDLRGEDDNTPVMMQAKSASGLAQEQLIRMGEGRTTVTGVVGLYPEVAGDGKKMFKHTWFGSVITAAMYRGQFALGSVTQAVEIDMEVPGALVLRFPLKDGWHAVFLVPEERLNALTTLNKLLPDDP